MQGEAPGTSSSGSKDPRTRRQGDEEQRRRGQEEEAERLRKQAEEFNDIYRRMRGEQAPQTKTEESEEEGNATKKRRLDEIDGLELELAVLMAQL